MSGLQDTDIVPLMTIIVEEIQRLEYSFPTSIGNFHFMIPYPSEEHRHKLTAVFQPIDTVVNSQFLLQHS